MREERADFHVHFGNRTEEEIIEEARENRVSVVAVLDRGIVKIGRLKHLIATAQNQGVTVIPGVENLTEVSYDHSKLSTELLGLDFDLDHPAIHDTFDPLGKRQQEKHLRKIEFQRSFLESRGFDLNTTRENTTHWETIKKGGILETALELCKIAAYNPKNRPLLDSLQTSIKEHLSRRPQDKGELQEAKCLYWEYFAQGQPGFRRWFLDYKVIINSIHQAGGVVIIPHPEYRHIDNKVGIDKILGELFDAGVDGIEGWDAGPLDKHLARLALNKGKLLLGGSGEDSTNYNNRVMGKGEKGSERMYISPKRLIDIRSYKQRAGIGKQLEISTC